MRYYATILLLLILATSCVPEQSSLDVSKNYDLTPTFMTENMEMRGIEGKIGFINTVLIANQYNKILWHFWGDSNEFSGTFRLEATDLKTGKKSPILLVTPNGSGKTWEYSDPFTQPNLGAIATKPSAVMFDHFGLWKIDIIINGKHFAELIVDVKDNN